MGDGPLAIADVELHITWSTAARRGCGGRRYAGAVVELHLAVDQQQQQEDEL